MKQRPTIGWIWITTAALTALLIMLFIKSRTKDVPFAITGPAVGAVFIIPIWLYLQGQRHFVERGEAVVAHDPRPPVVYLRSFSAESSIGEEEEAIADLLQAIGPFVAIGNPGDRLPPLGATRFYDPGADWRQFVSNLVKQSRFVLALAGSTPGLGWELQLCRSVLQPGRLIVLVPADEQAYGAFCKVAAAAGLQLPAFPSDRSSFTSGKIAGLVGFDGEWRGRMVNGHYQVLDPVWWRDITLARLRKPFEEVLSQRGIELPKEKTTFEQTLRRHWRGFLVAALVLAGWKLCEILHVGK